MSICCYCDNHLSCAACGREQPDDSAEIASVPRSTLKRWQEIVEQAMACIRGETPEDVAFGEAEDDTFSKLRQANAEISAATAR
jgi:hypothetical protein